MAADKSRCKEQWVTTTDGQLMCRLVNGNAGWLMYLRENEDAGFSSRNPSYAGPADAMLEYYLTNGQRDEYPLAWALPIEEIRRALEYFEREQKPPPFVTWHNDLGDGTVIGPEGVVLSRPSPVHGKRPKR